MSEEQNRKLTKEEKQLLEKERDRWFKIATEDPENHPEKAEAAIWNIYQDLGYKEKPEFIWCDSPMDAQLKISYAKIIEDDSTTKAEFEEKYKTWKKNLKNVSLDDLEKMEYSHTSLWGNHDAFWIGFYKYCEKIGVKYSEEDQKALDTWADLALSCGWWYPFEFACFICKKAIYTKLDEQNRLHNPDGPCIEYPDGFRMYALEGVSMPEKVIETPWEDLDPAKDILGIQNAEQRLLAIKYCGLENMLEALDHKVLDTREGSDGKVEYELLDVDIDGNGNFRPFLKMQNPSEPKIHLEGVDPSCRTVDDAMAWRLNLKKYDEPIAKS